MGSKDASTSSKKESWRDWKVIHEKKMKLDAYNDNDTSERGIFHASGIVVVVSTKNWASVASSDDDDELLLNLGSTYLAKREC